MTTATRSAPTPTTDTGDMALRTACMERRIEALATAVVLLLEQPVTPAQRPAADLARAALREVDLPHTEYLEAARREEA
ncbi:hypothetical protein OHA72_36365 [Dactylosporangium sp. NBC_01737]|uniref:hypothetical protein n=1 Tax=Dactylosporangium sp. NBC_01737 TaxID=2975959 RepID=UPI002E0DD748|nr:hypothetical protein OHA72_36365 [Dactylosporangium sp. NBC_01737]